MKGVLMTDEKPPSQAELMSQFVVSIEKISFLSDKRPVYILGGVGALLIIESIVLKLYLILAPSEFIALVQCATLLLVLASLILLYQYKGWREIIMEQQKLSGELMKQQNRAAEERKKAEEKRKQEEEDERREEKEKERLKTPVDN
jgi:amino acid permease